MDNKIDIINIYWIESHKASEEFQTFISTDDEKIKINPIYKNNNMIKDYISSVYIYITPKKDFELNFISENIKDNTKNKKNNKYLQLKEVSIDNDDHYFIYDFIPMKDFSQEKQFELFLEAIDNKYLHDQIMIRHIKEILFKNTRSLLTFNKEYFDFLLYMSVFVEFRFFEKFLWNFILKFKSLIKKPEIKIISINDQKLDTIKNKINTIYNNPEIILDLFDENKKNSSFEPLYQIIFLFNYFFQREKVFGMLKNKKINKNLFELLLKLKVVFADLKFNKEELTELITSANNFDDIQTILYFNHDIIEILNSISDNYEFIQNKYDDEPIKLKSINLDNYVIPNEKDNIDDIIAYYSTLLNQDIDKNRNKRIVSFSPEFLEKYIDFNHCINYINLLRIKNIIISIKMIEKDFLVNNFRYIFHDTGLFMITQKKFSNCEIFDFINEDIYYNSNYVYDKKDRVLTPLTEINLHEITKIELEKWKKIDWLKIFKQQENDFFNTIFSLVKSLEDFEKIFELLIDDAHFNLYKNKITKLMEEKLLSDFKNESEKNLMRNLYIFEKIIKNSMKYSYESDFVEKIYNNFDKNFVTNLFIILYDEEENIRPKVIEYISNFIDKEIKSELPEKLFTLIKLTSFKNSKIAQKLKNYIFEQDSFFTLEEDLKLKLLKLLIIGRILPSDKNQNWFLKTSYEKIEELKTHIFKFYISFNEIYDFFEEESNIKIFKERLGLIYLININDKEEIGQKYDDNFNYKIDHINAYTESIKNQFSAIKNDINN